MQCDGCQTVSEILPTTSVIASKALFIEFGSDALNTLSFVKGFSLSNSLFSLKAVVFCNNRHFTCGVEWNGIWLYIDDMCKPVQSFSQLADIFVKNTKVFFGIYVKKSEIVENDSNQSKMTFENIPGCEIPSVNMNERDCLPTKHKCEKK